MKGCSLVFGIILLFTFAACNHAPHKTAIAFYNCENLFDTIHKAGKEDGEFTPTGKYHYTTIIYNEKLHNIAAVLAKMVTDDVPNGPAIIGLAEIEDTAVLKALVSQPSIARRYYHYIWYNGPDKRGIAVAMLYDPSAFYPISSMPIPVVTNDSDKKALRDILYVKGVLYGDTVHLLVNHWPSRLGGEEETEHKRATAATICRNKLNVLLQHQAKVIVMGDFNENPDDSSIVNILNASGDSTAGSMLYDPFTTLHKIGEGTLIYNHHWYLFDQVMVSKDLMHNKVGFRFDNVEVFKPSFITDSHNTAEKVPRRSFAGTYWLHGYSDHFPVLMYLVE
ncbi:MAG: endonuclease/exonuclease/phosphatase [Flavipsychrobacter sp.]|nr:endonuclease/exonuclease/phosphatase [Flavipsychrobacter sp.]